MRIFVRIFDLYQYFKIIEMYKQKTNKSVKKRFKKTGTGKFLTRQAGKKHINAKMRSKTKRRLRGFKVTNDSNTARLKELLPYE